MNRGPTIEALLLALCVGASACASRDSPLRADAGADAAVDASSDVAPPDDTGKAIPTGAADALAKNHRAFCSSFAKCFPPLLSNLFGDVDTCVARRLAGSLSALFGPGSRLTTADIEACGRATGDAYTCDQILRTFYENPVVPADCRLRGDLANGAPCAGSDQCKSGFCRYEPNAACGACADRTAPGGSCTSHVHCAEGFACEKGTCVAWVDRGGACGDGKPCHRADVCVSGKCVERLSIGADCDVALQDCGLGATCSTVASKCVALEGGKLGSPCGDLDSGGLGICDFGLRCKINDFAAYEGACVAVAKEGESCFRIGPTGSQCETPLVCAATSCVMPSTDVCR